MARGAARQEWATRRERGVLPLLRLMVWIALRLGRPVAQTLLVPVVVYFFLFSAKSRAASLAYLGRALGRPATRLDRWRHYRCFASCLLDRVWLLNGRLDLFEVAVHGEDIALHAASGGGFLFGAHLGSFEVARAAGRRMEGVKTSLVMYEHNARKTNAVLQAINPTLALEIIGLGQPGSMLTVKHRLDEGHLVGVLADRSLGVERSIQISFLGAPAHFPVGPFRMAALLGRPVLLMLGLRRGGGQYDVIFETISAEPTGEAIELTMRRYVARLEQHCRDAPYNWFNFYDFWT